MLSYKVLRSNFKFIKRFLWTVEARGDDLVIKEDERDELHYPNLWLRDNCQCEICFHKTSQSRIINIEHFDFESKPVKTSIDDSALYVHWSDAHHSRYSLSWLLARHFRPVSQASYLHTQYRPKQRPWTASDFNRILQRYHYKDILDRDEILLRWLESLAVDGVALIEGASLKIDQIKHLANRVGFLKETYYGKTWSVKAKPGTSNVAYLSGALQLHSDLPYYQYKPGVNLLHCVVQSEDGGGSVLVDGLSVCEWLRDSHPHYYWILSTVPVDWEDIVQENGKDYHSIYRAPVICEIDGEIVRINWSQPQRGSHFNIPLEQVTPWYRALEMFTKHMYSSHCKAVYKMNPGEIMTFNNLRMLHGRTTFEGSRHLEGGYLDWDLIYSQIRVLNKKLRPREAPS